MILPSDCCEFSWKLISREYLMLSDKLIGFFFFLMSYSLDTVLKLSGKVTIEPLLRVRRLMLPASSYGSNYVWFIQHRSWYKIVKIPILERDFKDRLLGYFQYLSMNKGIRIKPFQNVYWVMSHPKSQVSFPRITRPWHCSWATLPGVE